MGSENKTVLRYRDGKTERVTMGPIDPAHQVLAVTREDGQAAEIPFAQLKAVFFPAEPGQPLEQPSGSAIAVEFSDGEVIRGVAHYNPERNGFFLFPSDRSKNDRIFVVSSAIASIEVERL